MKRLIIAVACLACGLAVADEGEEAQSEGPIEELQIRLSAMEQINVTAVRTSTARSNRFCSMPMRSRLRRPRNRRFLP
jgi:hypothetical protein